MSCFNLQVRERGGDSIVEHPIALVFVDIGAKKSYPYMLSRTMIPTVEMLFTNTMPDSDLELLNTDEHYHCYVTFISISIYITFGASSLLYKGTVFPGQFLVLPMISHSTI